MSVDAYCRYDGATRVRFLAGRFGGLQMSRHPLIEKVLGLRVDHYKALPNEGFVDAGDLERALEKGVRVYGQKNKYDVFEWGQYSDEQIQVEGPGLTDTHTALLLGITPMEPERCPTCGK